MVSSVIPERGNLGRPIPERIREAREARGLPLEAFAESVGLTKQAIARFESGHATPSGDTMRRIIAITEQPPSFFVTQRERAANGISPFWRGLKRMELHHRKRISRRLEWASDVVSFLSDYIELPEIKFPHIEFDAASDSTEQIEVAADALRESWQLGRGPLRDLSSIMELHGFILVRESVHCTDMDAVSVWQFGRPYILYSADVSSGPRTAYNLAHELGHMLLHAEAEVTSDNIARIEKQADRFASALLLPQDMFSREVLGTSLNHFLFLKEKWGISIAALAHRCRDLGILNQNQFSYVFRQLNLKMIREKEPLDDRFQARLPVILGASVKMLLDNGISTKSQIEEALALNASDIESLCGLSKGSLDTRVVPFVPKIRISEN
jgi:Zn-dependent peptidase ImmA (M78 family)/transcriptional regulator with XRE-family HTH domain